MRMLLPVRLRTQIRQIVAPFSFPGAVNALNELIEQVRPDLLHALRIPYEGIIASMAAERKARVDGIVRKTPLVISVWGNDFTLHARSTPAMAGYTRRTLQGCNALHTDCQRDLDLARRLGFATSKPAIVLPGGGGVKLDVFHPPVEKAVDETERLGAAEPPNTIINPRGFRAYVRNDTVFKAMTLVLQRLPEIRLLCPGMAGETQALKWMRELGIGAQVDLLPHQSQPQMAELFKKSAISLSITTHDGTPNTLLEAMACGCFPIAGDIESLREWITDGENGLLVDPADPGALASAIVDAISRPNLRKQAKELNLQLVRERAEYERTMKSAEEFYRSLIIG